MPDTDQPRGRRRAIRLAAALVGVAGLVTLVQLLALHLAQGQGDDAIDDLRAAVSAGDPLAARAAAERLDDASTTARLVTRGPVWWLASGLPLVGDDVTAVRTTAEVADDVADGPLRTLLGVGDEVTTLASSGGRIDMASLQRSVAGIESAQEGMVAQLSRIDSIETEGLGDLVAGQVTDLSSHLSEVATRLDRVAAAAAVMGPALGSDAPRTYLVLVQNNAEVRASGGMPGAIAVVSVRDGRVRLLRQGPARVLGEPLASPVVPLTAEELALFGTKLGAYPADIGFTPHFPRTAELAQALFANRTGRVVDGVLATDPVALSYLLRGSGGLSVGDERLRAGQVVDELLNGVYLDNPDPAAQDAVFRETAQAVFRRLTSGRIHAGDLMRALTLAAQRGRLLAWSAHPQEQALLASTPLAGSLPDEATARPAIGVYLNDGTGAKLDFYLDRDVEVRSTGCSAGRQSIEVTVTLRSSVPPGLPAAVLGPGYGVRPGVIRTNVLTYAPVDGSVSKSLLDGTPVTLPTLKHHGRAVAAITIDLSPGEVVTVSHTLLSGLGQPGRPDVDVTPGLGDDTVRVDGRC